MTNNMTNNNNSVFPCYVALRKELDATKLKYNESSEKLMDKGRQYQKLQTLYDSLRR